MFKEDFKRYVSDCIDEMESYNRGAYTNESNRKSYVTSAANRAVGYIRQYESILNRIPISTPSLSSPSPTRVTVLPAARAPHPLELYSTPEPPAPITWGNTARGVFGRAKGAVTSRLWGQGGKSKTAKKRRTRHKRYTRHKQTRRQ